MGAVLQLREDGLDPVTVARGGGRAKMMGFFSSRGGNTSGGRDLPAMLAGPRGGSIERLVTGAIILGHIGINKPPKEASTLRRMTF